MRYKPRKAVPVHSSNTVKIKSSMHHMQIIEEKFDEITL